MLSLPWRAVALVALAAAAALPSACRKTSHGEPRVVVIGSEPRLADPATTPLRAGDEVLLASVAQGLVRFDAAGQIVAGLAERWTVSDDGLSYIFRLSAAEWPDGRKVSAEQVARALKRQIAERSKNPLKDPLGAVEDVVAMTDRVIEVRLIAPRPHLLALLAQPQMAIVRSGHGTGPFRHAPAGDEGGGLRLSRELAGRDDEVTRRDELFLQGAPAAEAVRAFAAGRADLVLGGTFADLRYARRARVGRGSLRFDPVSGLFGLVPVRSGGAFDDPELRRVLSAALDRAAFVAALGVPNLAARATVLEPGLDGVAPPVQPAWFATPLAERLPALRAEAERILGAEKPAVRVAVPEGPGGDLLLQLLTRDWGALGLKVDRAKSRGAADFALVDEVAPSSSPAWFLRRFRCGAAPVCDAEADEFLDAARFTLVPAQRAALFAQAAAQIEEAQLFLPITAPVRWSLVGDRIAGFAGNRYARHTLTDLEQRLRPGGN